MLEVKNIYAGYGKTQVLHGFSAGFEKGKLTSIIGTNGCGKSTLLKTVLGIVKHTDGDIIIDGKSTATLSRIDTAKRVAYLSQGKNVPDMTVSQLVLHGRFPHLKYPRKYTSLDKDIAHNAMVQMGIAHLADTPVYALSGGMRQNTYIAMALAQGTEYILLDEPTTYLDISNQLSLIKLLRSLADNGKGIITVMHDLPLALNFSDKIIVVSDGTAVMEGTPAQVFQSHIIEERFGISLCVTDDGTYCYRYHN